jgi:hypothetical protein
MHTQGGNNTMNALKGSGVAIVVMGLFGMVSGVIAVPPIGQAAPWLAPAADERLKADWVRQVARELTRERHRRVLINIPFGSPQVSILGYLNDADEALQADEERYARDLVRRALDVLDDGVDYGWLRESDVRPIKNVILSQFHAALDELGQERNAYGARQGYGQPKSKNRRDAELANRDRADERGKSFDDFQSHRGRWTGYTRGHELGLTERLDVDRERMRQMRNQDESARDRYSNQGDSDRRSMRTYGTDSSGSVKEDQPAQYERGGSSRYHTDEFYFEDRKTRRGPIPEDAVRSSSRGAESDRERGEWTDPRIQQDRSLHERGREQFYEDRNDARDYDGEQTRSDRRG